MSVEQSEQERKTKALRANMAFVYMVGAANQDAEAIGKRIELAQAVLPCLAAFKASGETDGIIAAIYSVLGVGWSPKGEFKIAIDTILKEAESSG